MLPHFSPWQSFDEQESLVLDVWPHLFDEPSLKPSYEPEPLYGHAPDELRPMIGESAFHGFSMLQDALSPSQFDPELMQLKLWHRQ
jgi:hypothetical protein